MNNILIQRNIIPLIKRNYHKTLGLSIKKFIDIIPPIKNTVNSRYPNVLLVVPEKMISFREQLRLSKIRLNVMESKIKFNNIEIHEPYWIRFQDGSINRGRSPEYCRKTLKKHERGLTVI